MLWWAARPWTDTRPLLTPPDAEPAIASYACPSVFDHFPKAPQPTAPTAYPPEGLPCDQQRVHRVLFVADMGLALVGLYLLRPRSGAGDPAPAVPDTVESELL